MLVAAKIVFFSLRSHLLHFLKCEIYIFYDYAFMRRIEAFCVMSNIFL